MFINPGRDLRATQRRKRQIIHIHTLLTHWDIGVFDGKLFWICGLTSRFKKKIVVSWISGKIIIFPPFFFFCTWVTFGLLSICHNAMHGMLLMTNQYTNPNEPFSKSHEQRGSERTVSEKMCKKKKKVNLKHITDEILMDNPNRVLTWTKAEDETRCLYACESLNGVDRWYRFQTRL